MSEQQARAFRFHSCARCGGDAYLDRAEEPAAWKCLQCGRSIDTRVRDADERPAESTGVADLEPAA